MTLIQNDKWLRIKLFAKKVLGYQILVGKRGVIYVRIHFSKQKVLQFRSSLLHAQTQIEINPLMIREGDIDVSDDKAMQNDYNEYFQHTKFICLDNYRS